MQRREQADQAWVAVGQGHQVLLIFRGQIDSDQLQILPCLHRAQTIEGELLIYLDPRVLADKQAAARPAQAAWRPFQSVGSGLVGSEIAAKQGNV